MCALQPVLAFWFDCNIEYTAKAATCELDLQKVVVANVKLGRQGQK